MESLDLRRRILREPLGLVFDQADLEKEKDEFHLAATYNHHIVGILLLKPLSISNLKMRQVAVANDLQKKGIGQALVKYAEEFASAAGYTAMELHARDVAQLFYRKLGYCENHETFLEVGIEHKRMWKGLLS